MSWPGKVATVLHSVVTSGILALVVLSMMLCCDSMWFEVLSELSALLPLFVMKLLEFCLC
jgi:hypothetical protein